MEHDHRSSTSRAASTTIVQGLGPGKRTLTDNLAVDGAAPLSFGPARPGVIQRKGGDGSTPGQQNGTPGTGDTDAARGAVIGNLLESFQEVPVLVPPPATVAPDGTQAAPHGGPTLYAHVKIPYWNNKYIKPVAGEKLDPPVGFDRSARNTELRKLGVDVNEAVAVGKGHPAEIGGLAHRAIDAGLIARPNTSIMDPAAWTAAWKPLIEAWLLKVGVGLDCNGFVYEALHAIKRGTGANTTGKPEGPDSRVTGNNGILDSLPHEDSSRTYAGIPELASQGNEVKVPDDLQVADVMVTVDLHHVRIVMSVDRSKAAQGIVKFVTAESTVAPPTQDSTENGPRIHYWRFNQGVLQQSFDGSDDEASWVKDDDPVANGRQAIFRRHLAPASAGAPQTT